MKVLLLNPPFLPKFSRQSRSPSVTRAGTIYYPILLSYCCGVLDKEGFDVKLIDAPAKGYDRKQTLEMIKDFNPDLTVIETSTPSIYNDVEVAEMIKDNIDTFITLVGTHVSALSEETLKLSKKIDAVARMEYEYTIRDLAYALKYNKDLSSILGLSYRKDNKIYHNTNRPFIENLDELPFISEVYKKYLDIKDYFFGAAEYPMVMIFTGRGCPNLCFFCVYPQVFYGRRYRLRSAENVVKEFEYIVKELPEVKEIGIEDDTFTADLPRVQKICKLLISKGINKKVKWWANTRVNLDLETMKLMKKAGCRLIIAGFESGAQELLNNMRKGITLEQSRKFAENARKVGLLVHGCFMFGFPGETRETIRQTIEFAKELKPDTAQFFPLIPYPGTEAYAWAKKNGYLISEDFSEWLTPEGRHRTVISLPNLTNEYLYDACNQARKEFYMRKDYIFYKLKQCILHPSEAKRTLKSGKTFFKYALGGFKK